METMQAVEAVNTLAELIGSASTLDRLIGRLCLIAPELVTAAVADELAHIGAGQ